MGQPADAILYEQGEKLVNAEQTSLDKQMEALTDEIQAKRNLLVDLLKESAKKDVPDYTLKDGNGPVRLSHLFGDKDDLIVIHNMGAKCAYCTMWADGFNGQLPHLQDRAGFVVVSPDPPETQKKFADSRGWRFRMVSAEGSTFIKDLGFEEENGDYWPGCSTFRRLPEGKIARVGKDFFGPGDPYCAAWPLFDLLADTKSEWEPKFTYRN